MLNDVPFTENPDDWHCVHAAMHSVIKHFIKEYYSLDFLNALMNPRHQMWVWPAQVVQALSEAGLFIRLFSSNQLSVESIKNNPLYSDITNFDGLSESIDYINSNSLHEQRNLSLEEIEKLIHDGCVPIVILGSKKRLGKYVTLTGYDAKHFYYHESGPKKCVPNKAIDKEKFMNYWMQEPSNNMVIVAYGKQMGDDYSRFHY